MTLGFIFFSKPQLGIAPSIGDPCVPCAGGKEKGKGERERERREGQEKWKVNCAIYSAQLVCVCVCLDITVSRVSCPISASFCG